MPKYRVTYNGAPGDVREVWLGMGPSRPTIATLTAGKPAELELSARQAASLAAKSWATLEPVEAEPEAVAVPAPARRKGGE
jgi:hypothetical protein